MLTLTLLLALAAGTAPGEAQAGSAIRAEAADLKSTTPAPAPVPCVDFHGKVIGTATGTTIRKCRFGALPASALPPVPPTPAMIKEGALPTDNSRLGLRPLDQFGEDVIRFRSTIALMMKGETAWVVELHRDGQGASGTRRALVRTPPATADQLVTVPISMSRVEYDALAAQFDLLMEKDEPDMRIDDAGILFAVMDGASYLAERRLGGRSTWRRGIDGPREEHPVSAIERLVAGIGR